MQQEQDKRQAQALNAQPEERWQPQNPLQLLGARCAFPLGAGAHGGWRLGLSQRISERLYIDAKLRGAFASPLPSRHRMDGHLS